MSSLNPPLPSLRTFGERLATILGSTHDAVYERQRSLVRAGMLELAGRGRGGGTKATPENIALLLIACLVSDSPADAGERTKKIAAMRNVLNLSNRYTGTNNFVDAIAWVIEHGFPAPEQYPTLIAVSRVAAFGRIEWPIGNGHTWPDMYSGTGRLPRSPIAIEAAISGGILLKIRGEFYKLEKGMVTR